MALTEPVQKTRSSKNTTNTNQHLTGGQTPCEVKTPNHIIPRAARPAATARGISDARKRSLFLEVSKFVAIFDLTVLGTSTRQYKMKKMLFHFVLFSLIRTFAPTNNEFTELRWQWIKMK